MFELYIEANCLQVILLGNESENNQNLDQDSKLHSGASSILQSSKSGLQGDGRSLPA